MFATLAESPLNLPTTNGSRLSPASSRRPHATLSGAFSATTFYTLDPTVQSRRYGHANRLAQGRWQDVFPNLGSQCGPKRERQRSPAPAASEGASSSSSATQETDKVASPIGGQNDARPLVLSPQQVSRSGVDAIPEVAVDADRPIVQSPRLSPQPEKRPTQSNLTRRSRPSPLRLGQRGDAQDRTTRTTRRSSLKRPAPADPEPVSPSPPAKNTRLQKRRRLQSEAAAGHVDAAAASTNIRAAGGTISSYTHTRRRKPLSNVQS
ncbi:uncharacterized protein B0H18DRAFT_450454 [Fomitopsis serialis]|uniref:uncharacterized protein n=1 Tax=Fomitopsis serialis TaxID=139415 RepID=UPI0020077764|nr:uncharacterized protein B0H18DRAFT_450454 [Neoantrodia serialis]KAH9923859.1 hypothetical protein B0H18DRAFT_450454 [Neoantrodia serialis]